MNTHRAEQVANRAAHLWSVALLIVSLSAGTSCTGTQPQKPSEHADYIATRVDALETNLSELLAQLADNRANRRSVQAILDAPEVEFENTDLQHLGALRTLYGARDYRLVWGDYKGVEWALSEPGSVLLKGLRFGVAGHGMWPDELHLGALETTALPAQRASAGPAFSGVRFSDEDRALIKDWLGRKRPAESAASDLDSLLSELLREGNPLERLNTPVEEQAARLSAAAQRSSRTDVLLSDALLQYAWRMRFENPAWHQDLDKLSAPEDASEKQEVDASEGGTEEALTRARGSFLAMQMMEQVFEDPQRVAGAMEKLTPPFEPYQRLTRAFQKYTEYVEKGEWPELPARAKGLRRGQKNEWVATLKERLRAEEYYQGEMSDEFTQALREAVLTYQNTHQLLASGRLSEATIRSLNVSALERRHQIQLTLQRWRESRIGADPHFVLINLPDFHASVWRDGERKMYFGVVVGANWRARKGNYPRETPRFSDEIGYIVFNPYWNVTQNIRKNELEPKQAKDPTYFERNGYEYFTSSNGHRLLRQKPGGDNALGQVKFMFPNKYNVYMHDTPNKKLFKRPHRAYSHGCVRIEDPMDFADYLLDLDGRWMGEKREEKIEIWLEKEGETWINLRQKLPVHIEYYVVRVDDEGRTNFLADLYTLDEPRLEVIAQRYEENAASKVADNAQVQQREFVE